MCACTQYCRASDELLSEATLTIGAYPEIVGAEIRPIKKSNAFYEIKCQFLE
jgi:hypothetical protein